jgi:hypothetical protein
MKDAHHPETVAACEVCAVERCTDCGIVHLHFGPTSVRLRATAFVVLCHTLLSALAQIAPETVVVQEAPSGPAGSPH